MELVGLAFYVVALVGYIASDDFLGHILACTFFTAGSVFMIANVQRLGNVDINNDLIVIIYLSLNLFIITGLYVYKTGLKIDKVDDIK